MVFQVAGAVLLFDTHFNVHYIELKKTCLESRFFLCTTCLLLPPMKSRIASFLDFFYPPFRRIMPLQTFRYAACGGSNTMLGFMLYYIGFEHIFNRENFHFGISALKPHNAALFFSSSIIFFSGFLLNKYVVFIGSNLKGRIQLFRYFLSFAFNLILNYFMLKMLVEIWNVDPIISQVITIVIIIAISYITQKYFTFKIQV